MATIPAAELAAKLGLEPTPDGGYFRCTYESEEALDLPRGRRNASSAIMVILVGDQVTQMHRLQQDEMWHHYGGDAIEVHELRERDGRPEHTVTTLGSDFAAGQVPQYTVMRGTWLGARLRPGARHVGYALYGCTLTPGFDPADHEMESKEALLRKFPDHGDVVRAMLTR